MMTHIDRRSSPLGSTLTLRRGQNLVEVLIAIIFLGSGALAIYTANQRGRAEAEWGAEKVLAEAMANDLVEYYKTLDITNLKVRPELKATPAAVTQADRDIIEAVVPLSGSSFFPEGLDPGTEASRKLDPIYKEYAEKIQALGLTRFATFELKPDGKSGTVSCYVKYKSQAGPSIEVVRKFVAFETF